VAIGFNRSATGLERVMNGILAAVTDEFEVHWLGLGHRGPVTRAESSTLHPTNLWGGDVFAVESGRDMVDELDADVVLLYNDPWILEKYRRTFGGEGRPRTRIVAYCPIDGRLTDPALAEMLGWVDDLVVFTEFARQEVQRHLGSRAKVHVIGHGIDEAFGPLPRTEARATALPDVGADAFVVLNANRLQPRKRIDVTVAAFALLAADRPGARLVLHQALEGVGDEAVLDEHLAGLDADVARRVHVHRRELSVDALNVLYNACDVGLNTAMGEGWGLVSFEHARTGAAQVVPRHSACAELWDGAAEMVAPSAARVPPFSPLELQEVAAADVAGALGRLHDDLEHRRRLAAAAMARASEPRFSWAEVGRRWRELLA
jgi:glycosyltransferase involved in cell wall biosynthesis